jgi:hypothetical protein
MFGLPLSTERDHRVAQIVGNDIAVPRNRTSAELPNRAV